MWPSSILYKQLNYRELLLCSSQYLYPVQPAESVNISYCIPVHKIVSAKIVSFSLSSGVIGSGVCVFSRYPIIDTFCYRYFPNGYMYAIHHADWFGGKALGLCLISHPKQLIHFFTTHVSYSCPAVI